MWDSLPDPLPIIHDLECPECRTRFKLPEDAPVQEGIACPGCGQTRPYAECVSQEAVIHELSIARRKMAKAVFQSKGETGKPGTSGSKQP
jgi:hypothetical protein